MEKDKVFFAESGLTSTAANFIANLAKESYKALEQKLASVVFYTTEISLLGSSDKSLIRQGNSTVSDIEDNLKTVAQLKSLIAWLREALKAKERMVKEAQALSYENFDIELPEQPEHLAPMTMDEYIASLSIKERNRYYYLEALCATIGSYIHPDGTLAKERDKLLDVIQAPHTIQGSGRDTIIYSKTPSIPLSDVEQAYMALQQTYRSYQAELNALKHRAEQAINEDTVKKNAETTKAVKEYRDSMKLAEAKLQELKTQAVLAASNLKIVIPDSLKPIYDKVRNTGKD